MSAFIVSKAHIDAIVDVAANGPRDRGPRYAGDGWYPPAYRSSAVPRVDAREDAHTVGRLLWLACQKSVAYRYPGDADGEWPGPAGLTLAEIDGYAFTRPSRRLTAVEALKAIDCYEYQSCEHPEWKASAEREFCLALRSSLVGSLPGYNEAAWEVD
jgi:hypothetical protein